MLPSPFIVSGGTCPVIGDVHGDVHYDHLIEGGDCLVFSLESYFSYLGRYFEIM